MHPRRRPEEGRQLQDHTEVDVAPLALHPTFAMQRLGRFDPTARRGDNWFGKVHLDAGDEPVAWRFSRTDTGLRVETSLRSGAAMESFLGQFPLRDGATTFAPGHPRLARVARALSGLRLLRVPWAWDVAAGAVLQQRVRWQVAYRDFRRIAERWGTRTPAGVAFPSARQLSRVPTPALEAAGIDGKRARALTALARMEATRHVLDPSAGLARIEQRLLSLPGIGPWTVGTIMGYAFGEPDAVPVGDLHLPSIVTAALADEPDGTDARMLELLEPYRGQRFRVIRLLTWTDRLLIAR